MSIHNKKLLLAASLTAVSMTMNVSPVFAQGAVLEEIIVTARKRAESLQDVPIAVTAFDDRAIDRFQLDTVANLDKFIPNVVFADNPYAGQALGATIRGVGFSDFEKSFEPAVGFSIDGIFLASNTGAAIDSFDLQQVEVLRGPQGTLFGRNTVAGVINVTRTRPTEEFGLKIGTNVEQHGGREVNIVANTGKIGDVLSVKLHALKKQDETHSVEISTGEPEDQTDITSYGAAFLIEPNDDFSALVSIDSFNDDSQGVPIYNFSQPGFSATSSTGFNDLFCGLPNLLSGPPQFGGGVFTPGTTDAGCQSRSGDIGEATGFSVHTRGTPFITHLSGSSASVNIEYNISDNLTLTSITGYRETDEQLFNEGLGAPNLEVEPFPGFLVTFPATSTNRVQDATQFSQEFRLSGDINDRLTFVSGLFYMKSEYNLTGGEFTFNGGPSSGFGTGFSLGQVSTDEDTGQDTTAFAVFVDGTYDVTDQLSLSGGLRFSREEKDFRKEFILSTVAGVTGTTFTGTESWSNPTGRLIVQYELSDDNMVYAGYSRGFRSGGFNGRGGSPTALGPYDEETVDSFEVGLRAEFFNNKLRFNPTIFLADYSDKQEENVVAIPGGAPGTFETTVQNASAVDIQGIEFEMLAQVTPDLSFRAAYGYTNAQFSEFLTPDLANPGSFIDVRGERNLRSGPESTISLGATYVRPILDGNAQLTFSTGYNWSDETITSAARDPLGLDRDRIGEVEGVDFSLGFETLNSDGANLSISAFVNDAFDDDAGRNAVAVVVPGVFAFGAARATTVYGVELGVEF